MNTSFWILLVLGLLLITAAIGVKAFAFFTAEPKIMVDYLAEYNKISKPEGLDPNDNADELYKKAYEVYVKPSEQAKDAISRWYEDINEAQKAALKEWLEKNTGCMNYLVEGNKKKFFWIEVTEGIDAWEEKDFRTKENEKKNDIIFWPNSHGARLFGQKARVAAMNGRFDDALRALIECWKIGQHYTNPQMLWHVQCGGMSTKEQALEMALIILDSYILDANNLRLWQENWQKIFDTDSYRPGFKADRLIWYAQRYFAYHSKGKGRLAWKKAKEFDHFHSEPIIGKNGKIYEVTRREGSNPRYSCFFGPTNSEFKGIVDYFFEHYESYKDNTPWYEYYPEQKFQREIEEWKTKHPALKPNWIYYHRLKAKSDALITVIAVLRFKAEQNSYPKSLEILGSRIGFNYLSKIPQDPFSEGHSVYHWLYDDFELYSVGPDFNDDGGKRSHSRYPLSGDDKGDDVFWPFMRL
jgi:hypothetical protein